MYMYKDKQIYVFEADDGTVKVGVSENASERKKSVALTFHKNIIQIYATEHIERSEAQEVERNLHKILSEYSLGQEWFSCSFEVACLVTKAYMRAREVEKGSSERIRNAYKETKLSNAVMRAICITSGIKEELIEDALHDSYWNCFKRVLR